VRTIERSTAFRRDYRRAITTPRNRKDLESILLGIVSLLVVDGPVPSHFRDHSLSGN
jgi:mRNA interferase YafQ